MGNATFSDSNVFSEEIKRSSHFNPVNFTNIILPSNQNTPVSITVNKYIYGAIYCNA